MGGGGESGRLAEASAGRESRAPPVAHDSRFALASCLSPLA